MLRFSGFFVGASKSFSQKLTIWGIASRMKTNKKFNYRREASILMFLRGKLNYPIHNSLESMIFLPMSSLAFAFLHVPLLSIKFIITMHGALRRDKLADEEKIIIIFHHIQKSDSIN